jgi:hypothetical protein
LDAFYQIEDGDILALVQNILVTFHSSYEVKAVNEIQEWNDQAFIYAESSAFSKAEFVHEDLSLINPEFDPVYTLSLTQEWQSSKGCLRKFPMRYGDIESDGNPELAVVYDNNIVIYSLEQNQVVFSAHYWLADEIDSERAITTFTITDASDTPQYIAESGTNPSVGRIYPAWRSLTKIFDGEFDGEYGFDLVMWRKVFESNLNDEVKGFHKTADVLFHYSLQGGEYVLMETESDEIKAWLDSNELTWSQGYPSVSECKGEEGELIPEMHDPLLNDPEVFQ